MSATPNLAVLSGMRKKVLSETGSAFGTTSTRRADSSNDFRFNCKQQMSLDVASAKRNGIDREAIAERMTVSTGRDISVSTVDGWLAESKENRQLPLGYAPAWADATGSSITLEYVISQHPTLCRRLRLGEIREAVAELEAEERRIIEAVA